MIRHSQEALFNSKELNKLLPSYLICEINEKEQKDINHKSNNQFNDFSQTKNVKYIFYF